jgi:hypothetical protein
LIQIALQTHVYGLSEIVRFERGSANPLASDVMPAS